MRSTAKSGHTFIELLLATFLVGVAGTVLVAATPTAGAARMQAENMNRAAGLAQKQLETIRGMGYANLTAAQLASAGLIENTTEVATNTYSFTNSDAGSGDSPASVLRNGTGTVAIEQADLDLRRVTVTVSWWDGKATRRFQAAVLIANL